MFCCFVYVTLLLVLHIVIKQHVMYFIIASKVVTFRTSRDITRCNE